MISRLTLTKTIRFYSNLSINPQMRAWQIYKYGNVDQLRLSESYQTPIILSPNHVLVKVKAASINPIDIHLTSGYGASMFNIVRRFQSVNEFPITLGRDFSGTVIKVGRSVKSFLPKMEVIGALWPYQNGSHADYVVCCQSQLALKPFKLSHLEAASIPYAGLTAYSSLVEFGGLKAGNGFEKKILILGGGGGVGTIAIQIAKALGANVTVTCRDHSEEIVKKLGVDTILRDSDHFMNDVKFDLILDCIGSNVDDYSKLLKGCPSSRYVCLRHPLLTRTDTYSPFLGLTVATAEFLKTFTVHAINSRGSIYQWGFFRASGSNLSILANMVDRGELVSVVEKEFDFHEIQQGYASLESGPTKGKVVVRVAEDI